MSSVLLAQLQQLVIAHGYWVVAIIVGLESMGFALALAAFFGCGYLVRRYEDRLTASAERALPGPLVAAVDKKKP